MINVPNLNQPHGPFYSPLPLRGLTLWLQEGLFEGSTFSSFPRCCATRFIHLLGCPELLHLLDPLSNGVIIPTLQDYYGD